MKRKRLASSAATALQTSAKGSPKKRREETKKPLDMPVDLHDMECCFKGLFPMEAQDPDVIEEFLDFYKDFPPLKTQFKLLAKIGEGTFSSVYKAIDLKHYEFENTRWCLDHCSLGKPRKSHSTCGLVALKRIYVTSSPERIVNELAILHILSGAEHVAPVVTAHRFEDQVIAVLPYFRHDDFRDYFLEISDDEIRNYMRCLLKALESVHEKNILHRDVKPSNFLYDRKRQTGVLVDFGLAQLVSTTKSMAEASSKKSTISTKAKLGYLINDPRHDLFSLLRLKNVFSHLILSQDNRPSLRANRAGTRGFRAPEVLFKLVHQTTSIDIWSVGVILLCILSGMFPFFASDDDSEALMEISHIFGKKEIEKLATKLNRRFETNLPSVGDKQPLKEIVCKFWTKRNFFPDEGFDFLESLLTLDPNERITASEALLHPFLNPSTSM